MLTYSKQDFNTDFLSFSNNQLPPRLINEAGQFKLEFVHWLVDHREVTYERLNEFYHFLGIDENLRTSLTKNLIESYSLTIPRKLTKILQVAQTFNELGMALGYFNDQHRLTPSWWDSDQCRKILGNYTTSTIPTQFFKQVNPLLAAFISVIHNSNSLIQGGGLDPARVEADRMFKAIEYANNNRIDRWNWYSFSSTKATEQPESSIVRCSDDCSGWSFRYSYDAIKRISDAGLDLSTLCFRYKKAFILDIEEVAQAEIDAAAKKMKFKGDLSTTKIYRIVKGIAIKNTNDIGYGMWRIFGTDIETVVDRYEIDLTDHYIAVLKTPTDSMQAITTSIGRSLSSTNRQVMKGVMDSFELSF